MVDNILIFRTDRIGDLLYTCPAIFTIKKYLKNSNITLIASKKNHDYATSLEIFDEVKLFPEGSIINKIKFIYLLSRIKFNYVFVLDGKDRSLISSIFAKSIYKISIRPKKKLNFFWKFTKIKFVSDDETTSIIDIFQKTLDLCKINEKISHFNFLDQKKDNNFSSEIPIKNYVHIHLDEKWIQKLYIKSYTDINIKYEDFSEFLNELLKKNNILITTGLTDSELLENLKNKFFNNKKNDKIYFRENLNNSIYFIYKPSFNDLESLLRKAKILVSCHGAITHAANSLNIKILDILEKNKVDWYKRFNSYLKNYTLIHRTDFKILSKKIINFL